MMDKKRLSGSKMAMAVICALALWWPQAVAAHCDAMDGPVLIEARQALDNGKVTPVLKWVMPEYEKEVRRVFDQTLQVRKLGDEARELADRYFFETLVRVHREGEGASYTGIKPAGQIDPPIAQADLALEEGSVDELAEAVSAHVAQAMRERFDRALKLRQRADESVDAGREYVDAYVEYVHFVEVIVGAVHGDHAH